MRNPYHFTFDPFTGAIVVADVGEATHEEIDVLPRKIWGRANLGWPYFEGNRRVYPGRPKHYVRPAITYDHKVGTAIMGGLVIRDPRLPALRGQYIYADFCDAWIATARIHRKHPTSAHTGLVVYAPTAFGEDRAHAVYVASSGGELYRLDPAP
jgi:glucose/arabinose dehydrogenase